MQRTQHVPFSAPFTLKELRARGGSEAQLRSWLSSGAVRRMTRGVYVASVVELPALPAQPQIRRAVEHGAVAVPTLVAAERHGLWMPRTIPSQLLSADGRREIPDELLNAHNGRLIPSMEWTALQLARWQRLPGALVSLDCALRLGATRAHLTELAMGMHRWPGSRLLRRAIEAADARSESALESYSRGLMLDAGLPTPTLQYEVTVAGYRMRADFAFLDARVIGEADGLGKYESDPRAALSAEKQRQTRLQRAGFVVVRWGWRDVHPDASIWLHTLAAQLQRNRKS